MTTRLVAPKYQGEDERIAYWVDTDPWGGYDSDEVVVILDADGDDVSATLLSGAVSVAGSVITTPLVVDLEDGARYMLQIKWVVDGN
ncbi:unnamed protein product, partial [marine sediment metagenome]